LCHPGVWSRVVTSYCAYATGELRLSAITCVGVGDSCDGDSFCDPLCFAPRLGCTADEKRGLARVPLSPSHGWLDRVSSGNQQEGATCTIDLEGLDDCAAGLHCQEGTCVRTCYLGDDDSAPDLTCTHVPGTSPNVGFCAPP
jgi:hypothetical protein